MGKLTSSPVMGTAISKKSIQKALSAPLPAVQYSGGASADTSTVNSIIDALVALHLMEAPSPYGPELFDPATASLGSGVTYDGVSTFTASSATSIVGGTLLTPGLTYKIYFEWVMTSGAHLDVINGGSLKGSVDSFNVPPPYEFTFVADAADVWIAAGGAIYSGTVENISIVQVFNP